VQITLHDSGVYHKIWDDNAVFAVVTECGGAAASWWPVAPHMDLP
jgi:hypothetical protein